jgi:prepilin-type N-terminal cleavage/methylation domain-containing protein
MKVNPHRIRRGFTLIELTVSMSIGVMTSAMVIALFNQQLAFLKLYKTQSFLTNEAPIISTYLSRLIGKADRFRLHASLADALAGTNPQLTASPVVVLNFPSRMALRERRSCRLKTGAAVRHPIITSFPPLAHSARLTGLSPKPPPTFPLQSNKGFCG